MRLKVLAARDEAIQGMFAETRASLVGVSATPQYKQLLVALIAQGANKLETKSAVVRCRAVDVEVCKAAMREAEAKIPGPKLQLDAHANLPPPPGPANGEGASCVGGVHVISADGKTVCNNSLDDRLTVAFERNVPEIRTAIFGANPNIKTKA